MIFDAAVLQVGGNGGHAPSGIVADGGGFGQEVGHRAAVDGGLTVCARQKQFVSAGGEAAGEVGEEGDGFGCEDGVVVGVGVAGDVDVGWEVWIGHRKGFLSISYIASARKI